MTLAKQDRLSVNTDLLRMTKHVFMGRVEISGDTEITARCVGKISPALLVINR